MTTGETTKRKTTVMLDKALVEEAAIALGTGENASKTIHRAMEEVIALKARKRLAADDFEDLTPEALEGMRKQRRF
jgi:type III secretion system FlhB-like substrate exporter